MKNKIYQLCEKAKITLSYSTDYHFNVELHGDDCYEEKLTREVIESKFEPLINRTIKITEKALQDARMVGTDIDTIVLFGGSTKIPMIKNRLSEIFQCKIYEAANVDTSIAFGAGLMAKYMKQNMKQIKIEEVTGLPLGIESKDNKFSAIIKKDDFIGPSADERSENFWTVADNQRKFVINIYQGDFPKCINNEFLGKFTLNNITRRKCGHTGMKVTFSLDKNGMLKARATEIDKKSQEKTDNSSNTNIEIKLNELSDELIKFLREKWQRIYVSM